MIITATQLKSNLGKYLEHIDKEDIIVTRNGKRIAKLTSTKLNKDDVLASLTGIIPTDASIRATREERLEKHENHD